MSARIDRLYPEPAEELSDEALLDAYAFPPDKTWLRMNFVSSVDGAATRDGRSGGLGDDADHRVFDLLRYEADVILVAAGTVRIERYDAMRLDDRAVAWRVERGLAPQPTFALVSRSLDLDPASPLFTEAPVRPVVVTVAESDPEQRARLAAVAEVVIAGDDSVKPMLLRAELAARGLHRIHSEGGPTLFNDCLEAGAVDELCLTLAPTLEGGSAPRIAARPAAADPSIEVPLELTLALVLRAGSELLLRYTRS